MSTMMKPPDDAPAKDPDGTSPRGMREEKEEKGEEGLVRAWESALPREVPDLWQCREGC